MPGWIPSLAKVMPILASATAMRRSQASAMHRPAPIAVRMTKKALYRGAEHSLDDMLDFEALQQGITFTTADAREGVLAVMEKRAPKFEGR